MDGYKDSQKELDWIFVQKIQEQFLQGNGSKFETNLKMTPLDLIWPYMTLLNHKKFFTFKRWPKCFRKSAEKSTSCASRSDCGANESCFFKSFNDESSKYESYKYCESWCSVQHQHWSYANGHDQYQTRNELHRTRFRFWFVENWRIKHVCNRFNKPFSSQKVIIGHFYDIALQSWISILDTFHNLKVVLKWPHLTSQWTIQCRQGQIILAFWLFFFILLNYHSKSAFFFQFWKKFQLWKFLKLCKFHNFVNRAGTTGLLPGFDFMELIIELFLNKIIFVYWSNSRFKKSSVV